MLAKFVTQVSISPSSRHATQNWDMDGAPKFKMGHMT